MDYNDQELLSYIAENNEDALLILYQKYEPYIHKMAKRLYNYVDGYGLELSDLVQEGRIALNDAIGSYRDSKEATFYTFATTCIQRRLISTVISAKRQKHKFLNESVPFEYTSSSGEEIQLENILSNDFDNPECKLLDVEIEKHFFEYAKQSLTDFEYQVFELKYNEFNYREIAQILDKQPKAIDNALQRIKVKMGNVLKQEKSE